MCTLPPSRLGRRPRVSAVARRAAVGGRAPWTPVGSVHRSHAREHPLRLGHPPTTHPRHPRAGCLRSLTRNLPIPQPAPRSHLSELLDSAARHLSIPCPSRLHALDAWPLMSTPSLLIASAAPHSRPSLVALSTHRVALVRTTRMRLSMPCGLDRRPLPPCIDCTSDTIMSRLLTRTKAVFP